MFPLHINNRFPRTAGWLPVLFILSSVSCKRFVTVPPTAAKVDLSAVFQSDAAASSLMTGVYVKALTPNDGDISTLSKAAGLSADELTDYAAGSPTNTQLYQNNLTNTFTGFWTDLYNYIYVSNEIIEGVNGPNALSPEVKARLEGEAKFCRAFFYFYLVTLHGDVPLVTATDYTQNYQLARTSSTLIYQQMVKDLQDAENLLGTDYTAADMKTVSNDRLRPNKWAAAALLARVYLFTGDYPDALTESAKVISQNSVYQLEIFSNVFLTTSKEAIWQLQPTQNASLNTYDGDNFILIAAPDYAHPVSISSQLYNAFEAGDLRKTDWVGTYTGSQTYYYPYKYKVRGSGGATIPLTEDQMVMRLAEQYLIRAEAYIQTGDIASGIADLNSLRDRARAPISGAVPNPLPPLSTSLSRTDALAAVEHERQVELFTEWGDRWLTLKRMKGLSNPAISRADEIMPAITSLKGGTWSTNWQLYPLSLVEMQKDHNLTQNTGY